MGVYFGVLLSFHFHLRMDGMGRRVVGWKFDGKNSRSFYMACSYLIQSRADILSPLPPPFLLFIIYNLSPCLLSDWHISVYREPFLYCLSVCLYE